MSAQDIIFGATGQSLILDSDRPLASVTSVAVHRAYDDDTVTALTATTGSATVDAPTEAATVAAGHGESDDRKLTMASTAGFLAGRRYIITGGGFSEQFEVDGDPTATVIYARHPLRSSYAIGAALSGSLRATISMLDSWAADVTWVVPPFGPNPAYRVRWEVRYADNSTDVLFTCFDLVRYPGRHRVSWFTMDDRLPGWRDRLPTDHRDTDGALLIADAWEQVKVDLHGNLIADQAIRNPMVIDELVIARTRVATIEAEIDAGAQDGGRLKNAVDSYNTRVARLIDTPNLALDRTGGGSATTGRGHGARAYRR